MTEPGASPAGCPLCGCRLSGIHCKLVCFNCGYREDCSDLLGAPTGGTDDASGDSE